MTVKPLAKVLVGSAFALAALTGGASAVPTTLSFGFTGIGTYSVNTGDITLATTSKTIPGIESVNTIGTPATAALAGIALSSPVTLSSTTISTTNGPDAFTVSVGDLDLSFLTVSSTIKVASGTTTAGTISEQLNGTVTGDTSLGSIFLGQTVSISESCTQDNIGAVIDCSDSVITPGLPIMTPEPASLALLGAGTFLLGLVRRRRS